MTTQILIVRQQLNASVPVKKALEQNGDYLVVPFADPVTAVEYLRERTVDYAIVDYASMDYPGEEVVHALRGAQDDLVVIASGAPPWALNAIREQGIYGPLEHDYSARDVVNVLEQIEQLNEQDALEDRAVYGGMTLEDILASVDDELESPDDSEDEDTQRTQAIFEQLSEEEPPLPDFEESGTVTDLMATMGDFPVETQAATDLPSLESFDDDEDDEDTDDTPAQMILESTMDETVPLDDLPLDQLISRVRGHTDDLEYVREPDFLDDELLEDEDQLVQTTQPSATQLEELSTDAPDDETETLPVPPTDSEEPLATETDGETGLESLLDAPPEIEEMAVFEPAEQVSDDLEIAVEETAIDDEWELAELEVSDSYLAQLAVSLTKASLESTAQEVILSRGAEVLAHEGQLADADIEALMGSVSDGWDLMEVGQSQIRFVTLATTGQDYMAYSRRTDEDFILSMVFSGSTPLRDIRKQGKRLVTALNTVPEVQSPAVAEEPPAAATKPSRKQLVVPPPQEADAVLVRYTLLWPLRDPLAVLEPPTASAVRSGLEVHLLERGWVVDQIEVTEDYVYLITAMPEDVLVQSVVRDLQERAAQVASVQDPMLSRVGLWADSYLVAVPARELDVEEIQQYIQFYRM